MKRTLLTLTAIALTLSAMAQTNPRKKVIQNHQTITKDSVVYLPDTIACYFKELIVSSDTVIEKWQKGYVVWQTWSEGNYSAYSVGSGVWTLMGSATKLREDQYIFTNSMPGIFLYADRKTKVTNPVIFTIKR